ncbi:MAG TPA: acyl-CoA dehydrogenase family protein [Kofleriaceae bacterium]|nr:acyl-CoA dehydrogenase family protein [Kofleriaceae bacterium]
MSEKPRQAQVGRFLTSSVGPGDVFTREDLTPEQKLFGQTAADFMRREVLPCVGRLYERDWPLTRELLRKAGALDLLRLEIPEIYGGLGLDKASAAYVFEQIGMNPSFGGSIGAHTGIGTMPLLYFGSAAQKARYLPRLASGELIGAYALTEPGSGSDALAARTTAVLTPDGKHYVLNGRKMWITNGGFADLFTIFAKVDGTKFTGFLVERSMGVVSGPDEHKLGLDGSSTTELILDDVRVPVENVLGTIGEGHKVAFNTLNLGRVKLGSRNLSCAKFALSNAARYARERRQFGKSIGEFGMIQHKLAEMSIRCFVGDAMVYRTLGEVDRALATVDPADGEKVLATIEQFAVECSINKVATSEALAYVVDEALQVYGGNGYSREFPAERPYRDARITRIYEGTNEINRMIIPTRILRQGVPGDAPAGGSGERGLSAAAKRLAVAMLRAVAGAYGERVRDQQEVLAHIADVVIEGYAIESALARTEKLAAAGRDTAAIAADMTSVFIADATDRIVHSAKQVASALGPAGATTREAIAPLAAHPGVDSVAIRRRIAAAVLAAGQHPV